MLKRTRSRLSTGRNKTAPIKAPGGDVSEGRYRSQNAQQAVEKYANLAREALTTGDRVTAEGYYQHAEHYFRMMNESRPRRTETAETAES